MKASIIPMPVHLKSALILGALAIGASLSALTAVMAQPSTDQTIAAVERVAPTIEDVAAKLWDLSELSMLEVESSAYLKDVLQKNGFKITSEKTADVPTAFIAECGSGKPILGIMLEYDALPGLGNAAVPRKEARKDGNTAGHACGHNLIGAGALGAALALKNLMQQNDTPGTLRVYGGASEETEGAKVYMARAGLFKDLDAMLHWHPAPITVIGNVRASAQQQVYIEFTGKTAHAGNDPWNGRSALDAVELFLHAVNNMREHVKPTSRIHYVIRNGGSAPNIVPDKASIQLTFRAESRADVEKGVAWLEDMAKGAGLMTQTKPFFVPYFGMYDLLPNGPLARRMQSHLETVGIPTYTNEENEFAVNLQKAAGSKPTGMANRVQPLPNEPAVGGSTDVGDVSWIVPTMGLAVESMPQGLGLHTWMATASHGTSIGTKSAVTAAKVLAMTGWDILTDEKLREDMKADFARRTRGFTYESPIPDLIKEPVSLPDKMRKYGSVLDLKEAILNQTADHQLAPTHDHQ